MKLCSIIIVWADCLDLLPYCIKNMRLCVEDVIVIWSQSSNYGEKDERLRDFVSSNPDAAVFKQWEPRLDLRPEENERAKRNFGLYVAKKLGFTHFILQDADEFYEQPEFLKAKWNFKESLNGLVCMSKVYFKSPSLTIGYDTTLVPFIHKITPKLNYEYNPRYPLAWIDKKIRIDPTRQLNITSGVEMCDLTMHHFSWVRKDFTKKIKNSTARYNIEKSQILKDLEFAKEGYYCQFYGKTLGRSSVDFGIPEM